MAETGNSLQGFLKKKSLFSNSPTKQLSKRRSNSKEKSRDSHDFGPNSIKNSRSRQIDEPILASQRLIHKNSEKNLARHEKFEAVDYSPKNDPYYSPKIDQPKTNNIRYPQQQTADRRFNRFQEDAHPQPQPRKPNARNPQQVTPITQKQANVWAGLVNYSTSFQSARIESAQCLQTLSIKIHNQISNINYKIDMFNSKMSKILSNQFKNLRERIYTIVEDVFKQSQRNVKEYMKQQEALLAKDLLITRENLEKEFIKIENMKEEINKPQWRKVAGELLASELQQKVEAMIKSSSAIDVGHWEIGDLGAGKIKSLESQLKDIVRLNR